MSADPADRPEDVSPPPEDASPPPEATPEELERAQRDIWIILAVMALFMALPPILWWFFGRE